MIKFGAIIVLAVLLYKLRFWRQSSAITLFVIALASLGIWLSNSSFYERYIDPESTLIKDFEITDLVTSERPFEKDERIVLINFGNLSRREIAKLLSIISLYKPRVIGMDVYFNCERGLRDSTNCPQLLDTLGNKMLSDAIKEVGNIVLPSKLLLSQGQSNSDLDSYDSLELSDSVFSVHANHGFANLPTNAGFQEDVKLVRSFFPTMMVNRKRELSFATQIAMIYDSVKTNKFLSRKTEEELISFRFNMGQRLPSAHTQSSRIDKTTSPAVNALDVKDVFNADPKILSIVTDKIVLIGFFGDQIGAPAASDVLYYTPLNNKPGGTRNPDMFGSVIHANIISMILNEDYIIDQSPIDALLFNFYLCLLHVSILLWVREKWRVWFDLIATIIIIFQIALFSFLRLESFALFQYRLFFEGSITTLAIAGVAINIYMEVFPFIRLKLGRFLGRNKEHA